MTQTHLNEPHIKFNGEVSLIYKNDKEFLDVLDSTINVLKANLKDTYNEYWKKAIE